MNCDHIARYYEVLERLVFGRSLERRRFAFLSEARASRSAIVCGGGDGRFLARLLQVNSRVGVDFVDVSPRMVDLAERRVAAMGRAFRERVRFHAEDLRRFAPSSASYDLIVTNFFLDCFCEAELDVVVDRLVSWGAPDFRWMVSEFAEDRGAIIRGLYAAFRLTTGLRVTQSPDYTAALLNAGCVLRFKEEALSGLLQSSLWEMRSRQR